MVTKEFPAGPKVSIVMPALNEEHNLQSAVDNAIQAFNQVGASGEVIIINDGSSDRTSAVAEKLSQQHNCIRVINHSQPKGIGASFWEGVQVARGDVVTMLPGDGENDGYEILRYLPLMDHVDIVVPFIYNRNRRSLQRRIISKLYKAIINLSCGMLLNYMNGTVMYRRRALESVTLESTGFFYQTELLIKCIKAGYLYAEVPCALRQRGEGKSKALTLVSLLAVIRGYLSTLAVIQFSKQKNRIPAPNCATSIRAKEALDHTKLICAGDGPSGV